MAGLQRSTTSFRRQGSSGLIWDDKFLSGDLNQAKEDKEKVEARDQLRSPQSAGSISSKLRSRSDGGRAYRTVKVSPPRVDPPSPKASGCGLCGIFGKPVAAHKPRANKRKS